MGKSKKNKKFLKQLLTPPSPSSPRLSIVQQNPNPVSQNIFINHRSKKKPSSETLTPQTINEQLRNFYINQLMIRRLFYPDIPIPIDKCYINLSIVPGMDYQTEIEKFAKIAGGKKEDQEIYEISSNLYGRPSIIMPAECIIPPSIQVNVEAAPYAIKSMKLYPEIKVLILGAAGIGKSTLSEYYTHLWANPNISRMEKKGFTNFEWVFRIPLRYLTEERYPSHQSYTPMDVIERECLTRVFGKENSFLNKVDRKELETDLYHALADKKVLFILDGYDEFPENAPEHLCQLVKQFLAIDPVIVTSRPYNLYALKNDFGFHENLRFEITGFTPEETKKYINNFFEHLPVRKEGEAERVIDFLARNQHIAGACRIPINLELLCSAWEKQPLSHEIYTVSGIYDFVMASLCRRYLEKQGKKIRDVDDLKIIEQCVIPLGFLEHLGCKSASDHQSFVKLSITRAYVEQFGYHEASQTVIAQQKTFGFIRPNNAQGEYDGGSYYFFNHLTFRDFFAARYLACCLQHIIQTPAPKISYFTHEWKDPGNQRLSLDAFIKQHRFDSAFEFVWWFVAGLLNNANDTLTLHYFFALLFEEIDQVEISSVLLLIRCLDEAGELATSLPKGLWTYLAQWLESAMSENTSETFLYSAIWERLKLSRSVFLQDDIQQVFYKIIEHANHPRLIALLEALNLIKQPLPEALSIRLMDRILGESYDIKTQRTFSQKLANLCDQRLLSLQPFHDVFENMHTSSTPHVLSMAIEVLWYAESFRYEDKFIEKTHLLLCNEAEHDKVRIASASFFYPEAVYFLLKIKKVSPQVIPQPLADIINNEHTLLNLFLAISLNEKNPLKWRLEAGEHYLKLRLILIQQLKQPLKLDDQLINRLFFIIKDEKNSVEDRFFAFYLLGKFDGFSHPFIKDKFHELLDIFILLLKAPQLEYHKEQFLHLLSILHPDFPRIFYTQSKEWVDSRLSLLKEHFTNIASLSIKKYVAVYLCLNGKNIPESNWVEILNTIITSSYTREEFVLLTAINPPNTPDVTFTQSFCLNDCTRYLEKLQLSQATHIISLHHVLAKTATRHILEYCTRKDINSTHVYYLMAALVVRYMALGKALYLDEEGLRYFDYQKYQLLPLTKDQSQYFSDVIDKSLAMITHLTSPRLPTAVITRLHNKRIIKKTESIAEPSLTAPKPNVSPLKTAMMRSTVPDHLTGIGSDAKVTFGPGAQMNIIANQFNYPSASTSSLATLTKPLNNFSKGDMTMITNESTSPIQHMIQTDNRPSDIEYALMSQHVYQGEQLKVDDVLPENLDWKIKKIGTGKFNYFGAIYVNAKTQQVVLAHRGTNSLGAWVENIKGIFLGQIETAQKIEVFGLIDAAIKICKKALDFSDKAFHLSFTGHSLGAFLAEVSVYYCHRSKNFPRVNAVTFESPGCKETLETLQPNHADGKIDLQHLDIVSYLSYPNIVNTCNHHVGSLYALYPHLQVNQSFFSKLLRYVVREDNQLVLKIHSIAGIVEQLKNEGMPQYVVDWPMGTQRAYFFKYASFENGQYRLAERIEEEALIDVERSYQDFEVDYKAHYRVHNLLNNSNMLPLRHFETEFKHWLVAFYKNLWKYQSKETYDPNTLIADMKKIGVNDDIITALLSFSITKEQNGMKLFRVLRNEMTPAIFRKTVSEFLANHKALSSQLLEMSFGKVKESQADIHLTVVEEGADTSKFTGTIKQKATRTELPQGSSAADIENINHIRSHTFKAIKESGMNIKLTGFASGSKVVGNFQLEQIGDEVVMTSPATSLNASILSPAELLVQQQRRDGLMQQPSQTHQPHQAINATTDLEENKKLLKK